MVKDNEKMLKEILYSTLDVPDDVKMTINKVKMMITMIIRRILIKCCISHLSKRCVFNLRKCNYLFRDALSFSNKNHFISM